ncbi:MAG: S49 family peptidase [Rhodospirillales bacterium]|nr:S49 family peptidase [Rhodospirillales bacterium]
MKIKKFLSYLPVERFQNPPPVVAVVRMSGIIGELGPGRKGLSLHSLAKSMESAFKDDDVKAVAIALNSPGGSPVQSDLIAAQLKALSKEKEIPVIAFAEDVAASGGYWIACAADEIYASPSSIIGSIGVISAGFGATELIEKIGLERRVHTSGTRKGMLDPFLPEQPDHIKRLKHLQKEIHEEFKDHVRQSRGDRLTGEEKDLFSGEFWTGKHALELGLIDGIGGMHQIMKERFGEKVKFKEIEPPKSWIQRRFGMELNSRLPGGNIADGLMASIEERQLWNRYGL